MDSQRSEDIAVALIGIVFLGVLIVLGILERADIELRYSGERTFCLLHGIPLTNDARRLVDRYLSRSARFRTGWTWLGVALALTLGLNNRSVVLVGFPLSSDLFLFALTAWFIGLVRSEMYNLGRRRSGPREASLDPRPWTRYVPQRLRSHNRLAVIFSVAIAAFACIAPGLRTHTHATVAFAFAALVVVSVGELCQRAVALRARPPLEADLFAADEAIREVAARSVGYGAAGLVALFIALQCEIVAEQLPNLATSNVQRIFALVGYGAFTWAVTLAFTARWEIQPWKRPRSLQAIDGSIA